MRLAVTFVLGLAHLFTLASADHDTVRGVIVLARNGDRNEYYQDPATYKGGPTKSTPLGPAQSFQLGTYLRSVYLQGGKDKINGIKADLVDTKQVYVRANAGGEGAVVFDSVIALLQGLYPPTPANKITLANDTTVVTPLGGYQYVPVETVEPYNDRSFESWTDCPAFTKHIAQVTSSEAWKERASGASKLFSNLHDYVYGQAVTMENFWNVHEFVSAELMHNKSYAYRLPPTLMEQTRHLVNFHQDKLFSDSNIGGIGNIAGRTVLRSLLVSLERIAFNGDPLQFFVQEVTYHPFISLFHMLEFTKQNPELAALPNFASALAIELRGGDEGDSRSFLRFKFKNGTADGAFRTIHAFGHHGDVPLTEFIYRTQNYQIKNGQQWKEVCNAGSVTVFEDGASSEALFGGVLAAIILASLFGLARLWTKRRNGYVRIAGPDVFPTAQQQMGEKSALRNAV